MSKFEKQYEVTREPFTDYQRRFDEYATSNIEDTKTRDRRCKGVRYFLSHLEANDIHPKHVDKNDLKVYVQDISHLADTTISSRLSGVTEFYEEFLVPREEDMEEAPTEGYRFDEEFDIDPQTSKQVKALRDVGDEAKRAISEERVFRVVDEMTTTSNPVRDELLGKLLWYTAMRADEICRVRIDNIDFSKREIYIRSSKLDPGQELGTRYVYYPPSLDELMREWLNEKRIEIGPYHDESPYLFLTHQKPQMRPSHVSRLVKEAADRCGEQEPLYPDLKEYEDNSRHLITAHRFRHSSISWMVNSSESSLSLDEVRKIAGHQKIETTMDYVSTDWDDIRNSYNETFE